MEHTRDEVLEQLRIVNRILQNVEARLLEEKFQELEDDDTLY